MSLKNFFQKLRQENRKNLTEKESRYVLEYYGIKVVEGEIAYSVDQALNIAKKINFPVVLKIVSKDILHKTDIGGVSLNVKTPQELVTEYNTIIENVKQKIPNAAIDGIFVQKMMSSGCEMILGAKKDQVFGQVVMLGLGGIYVEVLDDISFRIAPLNRKDVLEMIDELKAGKIIKGFRGTSTNINSLVDTVLKLSKMVIENPEISEIDINPLLLHKETTSLDARIILE